LHGVELHGVDLPELIDLPELRFACSGLH
jgi:hypothetical protein